MRAPTLARPLPGDLRSELFSAGSVPVEGGDTGSIGASGRAAGSAGRGSGALGRTTPLKRLRLGIGFVKIPSVTMYVAAAALTMATRTISRLSRRGRSANVVPGRGPSQHFAAVIHPRVPSAMGRTRS